MLDRRDSALLGLKEEGAIKTPISIQLLSRLDFFLVSFDLRQALHPPGP
jgi:hypothetical protein